MNIVDLSIFMISKIPCHNSMCIFHICWCVSRGRNTISIINNTPAHRNSLSFTLLLVLLLIVIPHTTDYTILLNPFIRCEEHFLWVIRSMVVGVRHEIRPIRFRHKFKDDLGFRELTHTCKCKCDAIFDMQKCSQAMHACARLPWNEMYTTCIHVISTESWARTLNTARFISIAA